MNSVSSQPKVIVVTGVPGVGKTTVLGLVKKLAEEEGIRLKVVNFGDYMLKEALAKGLVKSRDEIRKLSLKVQKELQASAAKRIVEEAVKPADADVVIVDTHAVIKTPTGYWPGLPKHIVEILMPAVIFAIEAKPEEILKRQMGDKTRQRSDIGDAEKIAELMTMARVAAMASAVLVGAGVKVVINVEGAPELAAKEILETVKNIG